MSKNSIIVLVILVAAIAGLFTWSALSKTSVDVSNVDTEKVVLANDSNGEIGDHYLGKKDSPVVIVEYGDYQCYGCSQLSPRLNALMGTYKDKVAFIYRNFIIDGHQNSRYAIAAAEAAGLQGKYWEMHDIIFKEQATWTSATVDQRTEIFLAFAKTLILDEAKFTEDLGSSRIAKKIDYDIALAKRQKITGTPSVFVNGKAIDSEIWGTDAKFKAFLNDKLREFKIDPPETAAKTEESSSEASSSSESE